MDERRKKAVVTGGLGFIGQELVYQLISEGWRVYCIDAMKYPCNRAAISLFCDQPWSSFTLEKCDVQDLQRIPECDYVFNLAAESHVARSIQDATDFIDTNITGIHNILKKMPKGAHLVHVSTDEVYGSIDDGEFHETDALNPQNPYAASKAAAEMFIGAWANTHGLKFNIVRPSNNWGPHQHREKFLPLIVKRLQEGKKIYLHNKGLPYRSWLHVEDCCAAIRKVSEMGVPGEVYNIGGELKQNIEVFRLVLDCYNELTGEGVAFEDCVDFSVDRKGQDARYSSSDDKLRRTTGWEPGRSLDDGHTLLGVVKTILNDDRW